MNTSKLTKAIILAVFYLGANSSFGQEVLYGTNNYIEYHAGTLPIVVSVPHGGDLTPSSMPDRTCNSPVYARDMYTIELAQQLDSAFMNITGGRPHIIYNNLHRKKLDCNRNLEDGACGNPGAITAWNEFNDFIRMAQQEARSQYNGDIFYVDLHGHGNPIQRIELGYLLYDYELQRPDHQLDKSKYVDYSSIQDLVGNNVNGFSHSQLLRGDFALGTLLGNEGFPSVPSAQIPSPGMSSNYFSGGYNTATHTSYAIGNTVNGVQIECNYEGVRDSYASRRAFAYALAPVLLDFLGKHREVEVPRTDKGVTALPPVVLHFDGAEVLYPHPLQKGNSSISIKGDLKSATDYILLHTDGRFVEYGKISSHNIQFDNYPAPGVYLLRLIGQSRSKTFKILVE